jgi:hypothetical protein
VVHLIEPKPVRNRRKSKENKRRHFLDALCEEHWGSKM